MEDYPRVEAYIAYTLAAGHYDMILGVLVRIWTDSSSTAAEWKMLGFYCSLNVKYLPKVHTEHLALSWWIGLGDCGNFCLSTYWSIFVCVMFLLAILNVIICQIISSLGILVFLGGLLFQNRVLLCRLSWTWIYCVVQATSNSCSSGYLKLMTQLPCLLTASWGSKFAAAHSACLV